VNMSVRAHLGKFLALLTVHADDDAYGIRVAPPATPRTPGDTHTHAVFAQSMARPGVGISASIVYAPVEVALYAHFQELVSKHNLGAVAAELCGIGTSPTTIACW
jgi:hypothetical protein